MVQKGKVTRVIDGDTFKTSTGKRVRLANVNAPEIGRRGAAKAASDLRSLVGGKEVSINTVAHDKYGRAIANVKVGRYSVNKAMREKTKK